MYGAIRTVLLLGALALPVAACGALGGANDFDPTDLIPTDFLNAKKKLPGERKPVFPDGVPGTTRGIPPDLVKGYQPTGNDVLQDQLPGTTQEAGLPRAEPKQKAHPKTTTQAARPKPKPAPKTTTAAAPPPARQADSPWPDPPTTQQTPRQPSGPQWPDPPPVRPPPGSPASGVDARWPDPPGLPPR